MILIMAVPASVAVGIADILLIHRNKKFLPMFFCTVADILCCNFLSIFALDIFLRATDREPFFPVNGHTSVFSFIYTACVLLFGAVLIFTSALISKKIEFKTDKSYKKWQWALRIASVIMFVLGMAAFTGTVWGKSTFGDLAPDQMLINMFAPRDGTSDDIMGTLWTGPVLQTGAATLFFLLFSVSSRIIVFTKKEKECKLFPHLARTIIAVVLSVATLIGGAAYGIQQFKLEKLIKMYLVKSSFINENFVDPREVKMEFPEKKRNLIHIYLESMENSYISKDLGGYMDENLIKPLTDLAKEGYSFSHLEKGFGGPVATTGCVWSVASMVNMNTGLPMKVPTGGNEYGEPGKFLPGAVTIGDILASQGYEQSLMFGATAKFGGLNYFYEDHGGFNIKDYDYSKKIGQIPQDYKVWWGYEDDKLFEFAKEELTRLHETGKPFNFVMETADTHFPDGYVSKNTPRTRDNQYADVIAYSASETVKFVEWIKEQPFYENTTIVLIGDHNSMDPNFFKDFDESYNRTTFNLILNPAPSIGNVPAERMQNRWFFNGDMFPTVLASIGVKIEGDKLALGTNLFSDEQTLFEKYGGEKGWQKANKEFELASSYYNTKILEGELTPFDAKNISYYK